MNAVDRINRMARCTAVCALAAAAALGPAAGPALAQPRPVGSPFAISADAGPDPIQGKPAIASSPAQFFVVYRKNVGQPDNVYDIYGTRVALDGTVLDPGGIPISTARNFDSSPGNQYIPSVGFDGTNYLVVWVENRNPVSVTYELYAARVTPDGTVLDPDGVQITQSAGGPSSPLRMASIEFDGTNYLVAWRSGPGQIWATRITTAGVNLDGPSGFLVGSGFYPYVAFDGANFLVVWHSGSSPNLSISGALVSKQGAVVSGPFVVAPVEQGKDHSSVAFDGTNYLVVWHDFRGGNDYNDGSAYGARVSPSNPPVVLDDPSFKIADYVRGQVSVRAIFDGSNHFVIWQEDSVNAKFRATDVFGRRVSPYGAVLDQRPLPVAAYQGHQWGPVVGFNGGRYLAAWSGVGVWGQLLEPGGPSAAAVLPQEPAEAGWSAEASPTPQALNDVFGFSEQEVYAVGETGELFHSSGSGWTAAMLANNSRKFSLFGSAPGDIWFVGWCGDVHMYNSGDVITYNSNHWDNTDCLGEIGTGIWAADRSSIVMVGGRGQIFHYQGTGIGMVPQLDRANWVARPSGVGVDLWNVWGTARDNVFAVGALGVLLRFDGTAWQRVAGVPSDQNLNGIWGRNADDIFIVGDSGTVLHYDGIAWALQPTPTTEHLLGVWGCSSGHTYAVGANGTILRHDGGQWQAEVSGTTKHLFGVWGEGQSVIAVGDQGTILRKTTPCSLAGSTATTTTTTSTTVTASSTSTTASSTTTTTTTTASATTTTLGGTGGGATLNFASGWNLMGNSSNGTLEVATAFGDANKVTTVWTWVASKMGWAFFTPTLGDGGAVYAASKGYDFLTSIGGGEGFWVNAKDTFSVQLPAGTSVTSASFQSMVSGWNLIAVGDSPSPSGFNNALSLTSPAAGDIPVNLTTLWAWDAVLTNWYFYAPSMDKSGGLPNYIQSKSYLDFGAKVLDPAMGFWVNKP